ncbi:MAG: hypothetical protein GY710_09090 [Desulfobacteraceae bacterium]|nr:hypothetical protein [Desulfobacteraceae bacterium]
MEIIDSFEKLKPLLEGQKVGWSFIDDKQKKEHLHPGYCDLADLLKTNNDIVVMDILGFAEILTSLWFTRHHLFKPVISTEEWANYFKGKVDYLLIQSPYDQLARFREFSDIGIIKKQVQRQADRFPTAYLANAMVLKTYMAIYEHYQFKGIPIDYAANLTMCGARVRFYKKYLNSLGIQYQAIPAPRDNDGLMYSDNDTFMEQSDREVLISINNEIMSWSEPTDDKIQQLLKRTEVQEVHIFEENNDPVIEALVTLNNQKARLIYFYGDICR